MRDVQREGLVPPRALPARKPSRPPGLPPGAAAVLGLQRAAGNSAVAGMLNVRNAPTVQRCGPVPCDCSPEERADYEVAQADRPSAQRLGPGDQPVPQAPPCGPGTKNPFCLPIPDSDAPCTPFDSLDHALSVWADLSGRVPAAAAALTVCGEVKEVWDAYFAATSQRFAFTGPSSCVAAGAKKDSAGSATAGKAADDLMKSIVDNLPAMLVGVTPSPFNLGGPLVTLRVPLADAVGPGADLHPNIAYRDATDPANNIAGGVGAPGGGSDLFGDDDRVMGGTVVIDVTGVGADGVFIGQARWLPHVHAIDTADFCPGNLGGSFLRQFTVPMSKLEAQGLTRDVPFTIDYDLDQRESGFAVTPASGPPRPPSPGPSPAPDTFPRSGPATTTGSLLRIRTGPGLTFPVLGLLGERGTPLTVTTQVHGDPVDGNDRWDRIDKGFVSDRYVGFDADRGR